MKNSNILHPNVTGTGRGLGDGEESAEAAAALLLRGDFHFLRLANWSSLVYCVLGIVGFAVLAGFWPPLGPSLSAQEIGDYFHANSRSIAAGMVLMAFAGPFYFVWSAVLSKIIARNEGPMGVLSTIELIGGLLTAVVTFVPAVIWLTAALRPETRSVQEIQMLYDFGWMFFDTTYTCSSLQMLAFGLAVQRDWRAVSLFPQWTAWLAYAVGLTYVPLSLMPFFQHGPLAWNGLISFWAVFVMFFVYIVIVAPLAHRALRRLEREMVG